MSKVVVAGIKGKFKFLSHETEELNFFLFEIILDFRYGSENVSEVSLRVRRHLTDSISKSKRTAMSCNPIENNMQKRLP